MDIRKSIQRVWVIPNRYHIVYVVGRGEGAVEATDPTNNFGIPVLRVSTNVLGRHGLVVGD